MNKKMIIDAVSEKLGCTKKDAGEIVTTLFNVVADALVDGKDVAVPGFGSFKIVDVAERTGTIQMGERKGETYVTPAHKAVKFKPASALKEAVK